MISRCPIFWSSESRDFLPIEVLELEGLQANSISIYLDANFPFSITRQKAFVEIIRQLTDGNPGHPSTLKGVINFAGSIHSVRLIDKSEPFLISVHGTSDQTVPFYSGTTGTTTVVTEGSGLIHAQANKVGLNNLLIALEGEDHLIRFSCEDCLEKIMIFLSKEL